MWATCRRFGFETLPWHAKYDVSNIHEKIRQSEKELGESVLKRRTFKKKEKKTDDWTTSVCHVQDWSDCFTTHRASNIKRLDIDARGNTWRSSLPRKWLVSCDAPRCLTRVLRKLIERREKPLVPFFARYLLRKYCPPLIKPTLLQDPCHCCSIYKLAGLSLAQLNIGHNPRPCLPNGHW